MKRVRRWQCECGTFRDWSERKCGACGMRRRVEIDFNDVHPSRRGTGGGCYFPARTYNLFDEPRPKGTP